MHIIDWLIVLIPLGLILLAAFRSRRHIKSVADFLSAGRLCGRYVISVADLANGLAVITLVSLVEVHYKTGFAMTFWNNLLLPLGIVMSLTGYCVYRFRETRAMSLGQFLEMRYNRKLRIFAASLRTVSEMLANMICPAIAARFFIYFLDLPHEIIIGSVSIPTFVLLVALVLVLAVSVIWMGGTLALVITDTIQGLMCYPMLVVFTVWVLVTFSWSTEIVPTMGNRIAGESFLNPFDIGNLRDFNIFALAVAILSSILNRASWIGAGNSSAARTPHEQKMAGVLGTWRTGFSTVFYILIAISIITLLNHRNFSAEGHQVRLGIAEKVGGEVIDSPVLRQKIQTGLPQLPPQQGQTTTSQEDNADTPYLASIQNTLTAEPNGNALFQEFRTLYHQTMLAISLRNLLPPILMGLFALLMVVMMISTDDTRIFSAALTITQDVIMPLSTPDWTPSRHIAILRWVSVGVGVFFLFGSCFMAQLDYINLFCIIMTSIWLGGAGPVMIFGLYSKFGTTAGAFAALFTGAGISIGGALLQRNWADGIYPWLHELGQVPALDRLLQMLCSPFEPYIVWRMNPLKCPINSMEFYGMAIAGGLIAYCVVSLLTCRTPFDLNKMLHRDNDDSSSKPKQSVSATPSRTWYGGWLLRLVGITPEYSRNDRLIAWGVFFYSLIGQFLLSFVAVVIWNWISPWPPEWWGRYFLIVMLLIPGVVAAVTTVWFSIGGIMDLRRLFYDLEHRTIDDRNDDRDDGRVEKHDQ